MIQGKFMKKIIFAVLCLLSVSVFALKITSDVNGSVYLPSKQLKVGSFAPKVTLLSGQYKPVTIGGATGKVQIISTIESFNTSVCDQQAMWFNKAAKKLKDVNISIVTTNQPFVVDAFQTKHKIKNINLLSAFNDPKFGMAYGVQVVGGELKGITARSIFVVSKQGKIVYKEITQNIDKMPNLQAAFDAAKKASEAA